MSQSLSTGGPPRNQPDDDKRIFSLIAAGNEEAFRIYYESTGRMVFGYCLKMTGSKHIAREIMQMTYIGLWQIRERLPDVTYPKAYLMRIASRCVYQYLTHPRRKFQELDERTVRDIERKGMEDDGKMTQDIIQRIEKAMKLLPPRQQEVFRLCKYDGLSYEEVATKLGITVAAVNGNMVEAMKKIRATVLKNN